MGTENKLLLPINEESILQTTLNKILESTVDEVILVLGHEAKKIKNKIKSHGKLKVCLNDHFESGMVSSIKVGLRATHKDSNSAMICLADMPMIKSNTYNQLLAKASELQNSKFILRPFFQDRAGNPSCFSNFFYPELLANQEHHSAKHLISKNIDFLVKLELEDMGVLQDVDTKTDYEVLKQNKAL